MERTKYPLNHEWHVAVNRHSDEWRKDGKEWREMRFMYEAKTMADEVPRMAMLFKCERENALPQTRLVHSWCLRDRRVTALPAKGCAFWAAATDRPTSTDPENTAAGRP